MSYENLRGKLGESFGCKLNDHGWSSNNYSSMVKFEVSGEEEEGGAENLKLTDVFISTYTNKLDNNRRELTLRGNELYLKKGRRLNDFDLTSLCDWLRRHPEVIAVDLSYNNFSNESLGILTQLLQETKHIVRLNLMCNDITSDGIKNIAESGQKFTILSLRINGNKIGSKGGQYLAMFLEKNTYIQHLDMAETDQTASSLVYVLRVLQCVNNSLEFLDISRPTFEHRNQEDESLYIAQCIAETLKKMGFVNSDIEAMLEGLVQNKTLLLLDLSCNQLRDDALTGLAGYLFSKPPLRVLLLGHNELGDIGLQSLSRAFQKSRVQVLDLASNHFTDSGIEFFLNVIKKPYPIKSLYLWGNDIGKKSARILRRMLYSGILVQEALDVLVYRVDHQLTVAKNPVDRYKHIYYCVGDYGFPQPVKVKPPQPDVIPTQRINQYMSSLEARIKKRLRSSTSPQATTSDAVPTGEPQKDVKLEHEIVSEKDCGSLKTAESLQMEKIMDRMFQAPSRMIPMRLNDERHLRETSSSSVLHEALTSNAGCIHYADDIVTTDVGEQKEQTVLSKDVSIQTSMEFKGTPYIPPYPIGMVNILQEEDKPPSDANLIEEMKSAYIRIFQSADEDVDLSEDVNYKLNNEPLIISQEMELEPAPQPEEEEEEEEEKVSTSESMSSFISSKSEVGETMSEYQVLEKNIYGVDPAAPLPRDHEESLQATLSDLRRDSDRSLFQVIEDCSRVNVQRSNVFAWRLFAQEIVSLAINKAFEEIVVHQEEEMDKIAVVFDALEKAMEKAFEETATDGDSLEKHELDVLIQNVHAYLGEVYRETIHEHNINIEYKVEQIIEVALEKTYQHFDDSHQNVNNNVASL